MIKGICDERDLQHGLEGRSGGKQQHHVIERPSRHPPQDQPPPGPEETLFINAEKKKLNLEAKISTELRKVNGS